ncbi:MAG TPA: hypothetical protein DEV87_03915 [Clostridiales bacterium]|nr:hypothetical protein [Clostridiales bacterium]
MRSFEGKGFKGYRGAFGKKPLTPLYYFNKKTIYHINSLPYKFYYFLIRKYLPLPRDSHAAQRAARNDKRKGYHLFPSLSLLEKGA